MTSADQNDPILLQKDATEGVKVVATADEVRLRLGIEDLQLRTDPLTAADVLAVWVAAEGVHRGVKATDLGGGGGGAPVDATYFLMNQHVELVNALTPAATEIVFAPVGATFEASIDWGALIPADSGNLTLQDRIAVQVIPSGTHLSMTLTDMQKVVTPPTLDLDPQTIVARGGASGDPVQDAGKVPLDPNELIIGTQLRLADPVQAVLNIAALGLLDNVTYSIADVGGGQYEVTVDAVGANKLRWRLADGTIDEVSTPISRQRGFTSSGETLYLGLDVSTRGLIFGVEPGLNSITLAQFRVGNNEAFTSYGVTNFLDLQPTAHNAESGRGIIAQWGLMIAAGGMNWRSGFNPFIDGGASQYLRIGGGNAYGLHEVLADGLTSGPFVPVPVTNSKPFLIYNPITQTFTLGTSMFDIATDANGDSLTGKHFWLTVWITAVTNGRNVHGVTLPTGSYNNSGQAVGDPDNTQSKAVPTDVRLTALLLQGWRGDLDNGGSVYTLNEQINLFGEKVGGGGGSTGAVSLDGLTDVSAAPQDANRILATGDGATGGVYQGRALVKADLPSTTAHTDDAPVFDPPPLTTNLPTVDNEVSNKAYVDQEITGLAIDAAATFVDKAAFTPGTTILRGTGNSAFSSVPYSALAESIDAAATVIDRARLTMSPVAIYTEVIRAIVDGATGATTDSGRVTVAGGTLRIGDSVELRVVGWIQNGDGTTRAVRPRFQWGGVMVWEQTMTVVNNSIKHPFEFRARVTRVDATQQWCEGSFRIGNVNGALPTTGVGNVLTEQMGDVVTLSTLLTQDVSLNADLFTQFVIQGGQAATQWQTMKAEATYYPMAP